MKRRTVLRGLGMAAAYNVVRPPISISAEVSALAHTGSALKDEPGMVDVQPDKHLEPDINTALQWWPDLSDIWTPVGWKYHRFRYNVFFNGNLLAQPDLSPTATAWTGQGVQLRFVPELPRDSAYYVTAQSEQYELRDERLQKQGWAPNITPVLWTEFSQDGLLLRQYIFGHIPGANSVQTGVEPLFAWVRLVVHWVAPGLPVPDRYSCRIQINAPHVTTSMNVRYNIVTHHDRAAYPRTLRADADGYDRARGLRLIEPDGKVRMAIAPGAAIEAGFLAGDGVSKYPLLHFDFDAREGESVDLLVPMTPMDRDTFDRELRLGYDAALAQADGFWSGRPPRRAVIDVPEPYINEAIDKFMGFSELIAERDPTEDLYMLLSGSLAYVKVWATPTAKTIAMLLEPMGYHKLAGEYLRPFVENQGKSAPPSLFLSKHPGYLGSPAQFKAIDWMPDHGALLFAIANHALLSGDQHEMERYVDCAIRACEFIQYARHVKSHGGVEGILPPARYSDARQQTQGVWSDGWSYKGLITCIRLLKKLRHSRADEFSAEAADYKRTFVKALRRATSQNATWTDKSGEVHHFVPTSLYGDEMKAARSSFYLDTGPLALVFTGLLDADDPLMSSTLKWFRNGPPQQLARFGGNFSQVPFLRHELSSSIPGYSWNVFHAHQLADREHFIEGMYSLYAGLISQQTKIVCESRGGITGRVTHAGMPVYMSRLAMIDDQVTEGELHLLRLAPLAWLRQDYETRFVNMPTEFGRVNLTVKLGNNAKTLNVTFHPSYFEKPKRVVLHIPPLHGLVGIKLNGVSLQWDRLERMIELT